MSKTLTDDYLHDRVRDILGDVAAVGNDDVGDELNLAIPQVISLIHTHRKKWAEYVIGENDDDRYIDENGEEHDGALPIVQDYDDAVEAETRNELRAEQRERNHV